MRPIGGLNEAIKNADMKRFPQSMIGTRRTFGSACGRTSACGQTFSQGVQAFVLVLVLASICFGDESDDRYQELRRRLDAHATVDLPSAAHYRYFLPGTQIQASSEADRKIFDGYANALIRLAKKSASTRPSWAYTLLHEAAYFGQDNLADKVVASKVVEPRSKLATTSHPRLGWKRKEYYRIVSPHYQVVTRDEKAGIAIAKRLEMFYAVWRQLFFDCWSNDRKLLTALRAGKKLSPSSRLHRVVLFADHAAYTEFLQKEQPRIGITRGFYDIVARTSYFFPSDAETIATQFHEATHQLFQEAGRAVDRPSMKENFWIIEGIAMYMESLQQHGDVAVVGGPGARRLQFARYRKMREDYYVPLQDLVTLGREKLQADPDIRKIYSQSAGLTHFLMDGASRKYREGLIRYLQVIYAGRDRLDSLAQSLASDLADLDQRYSVFLNVRDQDLVDASIPEDHLRSLCLGTTQVTGQGLRTLPRQANLTWLDVAGLQVNDESLGFLQGSTRLTQLSCDQCREIGDGIFDIVVGNRDLDELDLSGTQVSDEGFKRLAGHPALGTLYISNTALTDDVVATLASLESLKLLGCGGSQISGKALQGLKRKRPDIEIVE